MKRKENVKRRYTEQGQSDKIVPDRKGSFSALHYKRIKIIEELARETEDPIGHREIMLFLAFNSARQIYPFETAKKICRKINRSFSEPLSSIEHVFREDKIYKIKNETFFEKLGISQSELMSTGKYEMSKPNITRDLERQKRKAERQAKKERAEKLIKSGMKQKSVAEQTGLSLSTVARISVSISKQKKAKK